MRKSYKSFDDSSREKDNSRSENDCLKNSETFESMKNNRRKAKR